MPTRSQLAEISRAFNREFDDLDDAEKEKVIEQLHATWSDPGNEVVKRMGQFKEKSPEILKPILES